MSPPAIEVRSLTKRYRSVTAVNSLEFEVPAGKVTGFLGPNGSGKTTTMRVLVGLARPTSGDARVLGGPYRELTHPARRVGALIDGSGFHPMRTARAHLRAMASQAGVADRRVEEVLDQVDLTESAGRRVGTFSLGMRQRLGLAGALLGDPDVLVLDEPANGLDPAGMRWIRSLLNGYAASGRTVFVSSHVLSELAQFVDEVVVVRKGELVTHTAFDDLMASGQVAVRTTETDRLTRSLLSAGASVQSLGDGELRVTGLDADQVGDLARLESVTLHELGAVPNTLEDVFLRLTEGDERARHPQR